MARVTRPAAPSVACVIPAKDEAAGIAATVKSAFGIDGVDVVVVVDDGSSDDTAGPARGAGAVVVRHPVNRGKAAAMETGARATGWRAEQPLSGQRCLTRAAFDAALPLAPGFGVEVGLSIDLLRKGFRVLEVEVELQHRVTGTDWAAQWHRAVQWKAVAAALSRRGVVPHPGTVRGPRGT
jgi:glycosyltransferase involved in cell wall biosynthesis